MKIKLILFFIMLNGIVRAQYTVLHNFDETYWPQAVSSLTVSGGKLYGMTNEGGSGNFGMIFSIDKTGGGYTNLLNFNYNGNGAYPYGALILLNGMVYGMTQLGGVYDGGLIFSIDTDGSDYKDRYDFDTNGAAPMGSLTLFGNKFYGMTSLEGVYDAGDIFSIDTDGSGYKDLHDFYDTTYMSRASPSGNVTLSGGKLFGMTYGGGAYNGGVIFSIDTNGNNYKVLLNFDGINGEDPTGSFTLIGGTLYGMTAGGGTPGNGNIFSIDTNGSGLRDLFDFNGTNGANPCGNLTLSGGAFYGMTAGGGKKNNGVIFSIDTNGSGYIILLNFNDTNGANPYGSLTLLGNTFYGMTYAGGTDSEGVVFSYKDVDLGINEVTATKGTVNVYPNPSNGQFTISIKNYELGSNNVEVYNMLGQKVYSEALRSSQGGNSINISNQSNGVYLYRVIAENGNLVGEGKMIITK